MSPDYAQAFDAGQRQAFMDRVAGTRQPRPTRLQCEADRGWWDGYTPRDASWWQQQPLVNRDHIVPVPLHLADGPIATVRQRLNPPDQRDVQRLLMGQRDREAA